MSENIDIFAEEITKEPTKNTITNSPFNYTGSKFKLLEQLLLHFDYTKENFVDLFAGGGSVYSNIVDKYKRIYINDIIRDLIEIHHEIIYKTSETIEEVKLTVVNKDDQEGYHKLRDSYNDNPTPIKLYALMLCCTNNMMRFNKDFKFNQTFGKRSFNPKTEEKILNFAEKIKPYKDNLIFSSTSFKSFVVPDNSFVYIDPPYSNTEAGYNSYWNKDDDVKLFEYCKELHKRGITFAVSGVEINEEKECKLLNLLHSEKDFNRIELEFNYNKVSRAGSKDFKEILITNYERTY